MRKLIAALLVASATVVVPSTQAFACSDCGPGSSGSRQGDGGVVIVTDGGSNPGSPSGSTGSPSGGAPSNPLVCHVYSAVDAAGGNGDVATKLDPSTIAAGTSVWQVCIDTVLSEVVYSGAFTWGAGQVTPYVPPQVLAQRARSQLVLPLPVARTWPMPDNQVVRIPTWLHVNNFSIDERTASVGGVSATVRAEPVQVTWNMGDGSEVSCVTGGAVYVAGQTNADLSDCSYEFERTSARELGQAFSGSVSITWHLAWTSNVGPGGNLGSVTRTSPIDWRVEQIQSVIVNEGKR